MNSHQILIVDHNNSSAHRLLDHLKQSGYEGLLAANGEIALQIIRTATPDLVVLNLRLRDRDGLDIVRTIRNDPLSADLPIIIVSTCGTCLDRVMGLESGADDYLTWPFRPLELLARVRAVLRRYSWKRSASNSNYTGPGHSADKSNDADHDVAVQETDAGQRRPEAATGQR